MSESTDLDEHGAGPSPVSVLQGIVTFGAKEVSRVHSGTDKSHGLRVHGQVQGHDFEMTTGGGIQVGPVDGQLLVGENELRADGVSTEAMTRDEDEGEDAYLAGYHREHQARCARRVSAVLATAGLGGLDLGHGVTSEGAAIPSNRVGGWFPSCSLTARARVDKVAVNCLVNGLAGL